jgi:hypothetical protein
METMELASEAFGEDSKFHTRVVNGKVQARKAKRKPLAGQTANSAYTATCYSDCVEMCQDLFPILFPILSSSRV